ncbi:MAG: hypothetical protein ACOC3B_02965 [Bacillota bacterium]
MKKEYMIYIAIAAIILVIGMIFGARIAALLGIAGGAAVKKKKALDRVDKAGDDIEAEEFDDGDSAAEYLDDVLSDRKDNDSE